MNESARMGNYSSCLVPNERLHSEATVEKRTQAPEQHNVIRDSRRAYEAPKVLLKRSVAQATLVTVPNATGPASTGLTGP
jgi:hypothetical protein